MVWSGVRLPIFRVRSAMSSAMLRPPLVCQVGEEIDDANGKNKPKGQLRYSAWVSLVSASTL